MFCVQVEVKLVLVHIKGSLFYLEIFFFSTNINVGSLLCMSLYLTLTLLPERNHHFKGTLLFGVLVEKLPPQVVPWGHCGVSQEQILLSFWCLLWRPRWCSIRGSPDLSGYKFTLDLYIYIQNIYFLGVGGNAGFKMCCVFPNRFKC